MSSDLPVLISSAKNNAIAISLSVLRIFWATHTNCCTVIATPIVWGVRKGGRFSDVFAALRHPACALGCTSLSPLRGQGENQTHQLCGGPKYLWHSAMSIVLPFTGACPYVAASLPAVRSFAFRLRSSRTWSIAKCNSALPITIQSAESDVGWYYATRVSAFPVYVPRESFSRTE